MDECVQNCEFATSLLSFTAFLIDLMFSLELEATRIQCLNAKLGKLGLV